MHRPAALSVPMLGIGLVLGGVLGGMLLLTGCAPEPSSVGSASPAPPPSASDGTAAAPATGSPATPATTPAGALPIPSDCRAILTPAVLAQLEGVPLNDPLFAPVGPQPDGSLICVWGDPQADTTGLTTRITRIGEGEALDQLNALADDEGFTCYKPDAGTRCEKTFPNPTYPVTDGRTLYYRDGVIIDTRFSNLAPDGYTAAIVAALYPPTPSSTPTPPA